MPIFYDPMISKLIAWAEDRPSAIARMRRALREYVIGGIKTTLPFFAWLLDQPDFAAGRFHTTFLDEILASRNGRPFVEPTPEVEEVAVMAAALQAVLSPAAVAYRTRMTAIEAGTAAGRTRARSRRGLDDACSSKLKQGAASGTSPSVARATVLQSASMDVSIRSILRALTRTLCR